MVRTGKSEMGTADFNDRLPNNRLPASGQIRTGRIRKMAVLTECDRCQRPVVGVTIREMPGWCSVECKSCGHSTSLHVQVNE